MCLHWGNCYFSCHLPVSALWHWQLTRSPGSPGSPRGLFSLLICQKINPWWMHLTEKKKKAWSRWCESDHLSLYCRKPQICAQLVLRYTLLIIIYIQHTDRISAWISPSWCLMSLTVRTCAIGLTGIFELSPQCEWACDCGIAELSTVYSWLLTHVFQPWISCGLQK